MGKEGCSGGRGSQLCGAGAAAVATHSPRALAAGGSAASGRASTGSRVQQRGRPAAACARASRLCGAPGPKRSKRQRKSPRAEPGEPAAEAPVPLRRFSCQPGSDRLTTPPAQSPSPRHPLPQGWSKSLRGARSSAPFPGSLPPTDRSRLRARPAQAGEVSCARRLAREPAGGRAKAAKRRDHGLGLGEPLLSPGTAGSAVRAGTARGLSAPSVPDARLHQPLGSEDRRRIRGGRPHSQQVRIHQRRTGN